MIILIFCSQSYYCTVVVELIAKKAMLLNNRNPLNPRVEFINVLRAAFSCADHKSAKKTDGLIVFWDLRA